MRSFVAIEISDDKIIDSIEKFQKTIEINAKPVNSRNLHFTAAATIFCRSLAVFFPEIILHDTWN